MGFVQGGTDSGGVGFLRIRGVGSTREYVPNQDWSSFLLEGSGQFSIAL